MSEDTLTYADILQWLENGLARLEKEQQYLDRLDAAIGDGDHGRTVNEAFAAAIGARDTQQEADIGKLLIGVGRSLAFSAGAATGPLFGTVLMEAGKVVRGKDVIGLTDLTAMIQAGEAGLQKRGKVNVGDKTMLDTLYPFRAALEGAEQRGESLPDALESAKQAAKEGMESTKDMVSHKGRSARLGERSKGHIDPGSASLWMLLDSL